MRKSVSTKKFIPPRDNFDDLTNDDIRPLSNDGSLPNLTDLNHKDGKLYIIKKQVNWGKSK